MDQAYKDAKQRFVSDTTGSSVGHVNAISFVALSSIALYCALRSRFTDPAPVNTFAVQFVLLSVPLLLSFTFFAVAPGKLNVILLAPTAFLLFLPFRERGTPLPSHGPISPHTDRQDDAPSVPRPVGVVQPMHAVTIWRAHMMLMTVLCILAVDFQVFPRALAKCESFGVSIMDLGVGSFIFSQGFVSAIPLLKNPASVRAPAIPKLLFILRKTAPLIALGLMRVVMVKGTDYPEHATEYGVHWNFFLTLALAPIAQVMLHPLIPHFSVAGLALFVASVHHLGLTHGGLASYSLNAPRIGLLSANKEGIISLPGYVAIHLLGLSAGTLVLPPAPSYFPRALKAKINPPITRDDGRAAIELAAWAALWWAAFGACTFLGVGGGVSRRLVNLPYILWVAAFNVSFLLGYLALDLAFRPSPESSARGTARSRTTTPVSPAPPVAMLPSTGAGAPPLLEALNRNSLIVFLLANVMTGIVNLTIRTLEASNLFAMSVLTLYSLVVCGVAWTFRNRRIWKM